MMKFMFSTFELNFMSIKSKEIANEEPKMGTSSLPDSKLEEPAEEFQNEETKLFRPTNLNKTSKIQSQDENHLDQLKSQKGKKHMNFDSELV